MNINRLNKIVKEKIKQLKEICKDILFNYSKNGKGDWLVVSIDRFYIPAGKQNAVYCNGIRLNPKKRIILHRDFIRSIEFQNFSKYTNTTAIQVEVNTKGAKYLHDNCNISLSWLTSEHIDLNQDLDEFYYFETEEEAKLFVECKD